MRKLDPEEIELLKKLDLAGEKGLPMSGEYNGLFDTGLVDTNLWFVWRTKVGWTSDGVTPLPAWTVGDREDHRLSIRKPYRKNNG